MYQSVGKEVKLRFFLLNGFEFSLGEQEDGSLTVNAFRWTLYKID